VHIFGEVQRPGEYVVDDQTTVLELISKAGGPTNFAKLSKVKITSVPGADDTENVAAFRPTVVEVNLDDYLKNGKSVQIPLLKPGDVVTIPRNGWFKFTAVVGVFRDLAVIASAYFIAVRAIQESN
jgi:protein involved in polysaccharide export with SLBB domain